MHSFAECPTLPQRRHLVQRFSSSTLIRNDRQHPMPGTGGSCGGRLSFHDTARASAASFSETQSSSRSWALSTRMHPHQHLAATGKSMTRAHRSFMVSLSLAARPKTSPRTSPIWSWASFSGSLEASSLYKTRSPPSLHLHVSSKLRCTQASKAGPSRSVKSHGLGWLLLGSRTVIILAKAHALNFRNNFCGASSSQENLLRFLSVFHGLRRTSSPPRRGLLELCSATNVGSTCYPKSPAAPVFGTRAAQSSFGSADQVQEACVNRWIDR